MVKAAPLYRLDEQNNYVAAGAFFCDKCKHVWGNEHGAQKCCMPHEEQYPKLPCETCGLELSHRHEGRFCEQCWIAWRIEIRRQNLYTESDIPKHQMCLNYDDNYFDEFESFFEWWEEHIYDYSEEDKPRRPRYLFLTDEKSFEIDADHIVESALEDTFEDAGSTILGHEIKELQTFLDKWCEERGIVWYEANDEVVEIPWERHDNRPIPDPSEVAQYNQEN